MQRAQQQWRAFMVEAPPYPENDVGGRGVVILSGTLPYMVPSWVNIHVLRLTGAHLGRAVLGTRGEGQQRKP